MFKLIVSHEPFFNPQASFEWPPRFFRWYWLAWMVGLALLAVYPYATNARIYRKLQ